MTVEELICELMASCQSLDDQVIVGEAGIVTRVSGYARSPTEAQVHLNDYESSSDRSVK